MAKAYTCPTKRRSTVKFDGQREALTPKAAKKNKSHITPKTKAMSKITLE
jgi:hypothetical protein